MRPVYYVSRLKNDAERRYTDAQIVLASLVYACRRLRSYLLPHPFVVMTSCTLLLELVNNSNLSKGMIKWVAELQENSFTFLVEGST